jgi:ABC-type uncharacterized transport system permease subunit
VTDLDLWEMRTLHGGLSLELRGEEPALLIVQGSDWVRVELASVKLVVAAMAGAAGDLAPLTRASYRWISWCRRQTQP